MGISIGMSSCSYYDTPAATKSLPNPDPRNFSVDAMVSVNSKWILKVTYHDCTNYEGAKIMVFEKKPPIDVIDPHFCDSKDHISPIARFEPTDRGWKMAVQFCNYVPI